MPTTINNTLPMNWDSSIAYNLGDTVTYGNSIIYRSLVSNNLNHRPSNSPDYWEPLDIYTKDATRMPHGDYSGDENFWERDNIYIDSNGWVYVNDETTGINVRGASAATISFDDLTPEQIEQIRGPRGVQGVQGPAGPTGPEGPMGEVVLTPEQITALKGDPGESAYQIWLDQGHTGTEADFLEWMTSQSVTLDTELLSSSTNPVENRAIYNSFFAYQAYLNTIIQDYERRITALENRLKALYGNTEYEFTFAINESGKYGYLKDGVVIPFNYLNEDLQVTEPGYYSPISDSQFAEQQVITQFTTSGGDMSRRFNTLSTASLVNDLAPGDNEPDTSTYTTSVILQRFEDVANTQIYIFNNGDVQSKPIGFGQYKVTENTSTITNEEEENIEGIYLGGNAHNYGHTVFITVEPKIPGTTINYQIGRGTSAAKLPSVVNGTGRISYENGSFNSKVTLSYDIKENNITYFASTSNAGYIITKIYLE